MIKTNDLQHLQDSINSLRDCETFNKDSLKEFGDGAATTAGWEE